jgi:hypothetical protein
VASASTISPEYYVSADGSPPTYNPAQTIKRRMEYPSKNRLPTASAKSDTGALFYGSVKGVRAQRKL